MGKHMGKFRDIVGNRLARKGVFSASALWILAVICGSGETVQAQLIVTSTAITDGKQQRACKIVSVSPKVIDFGPVLIGTQSPLQTLRVGGSESVLRIQANRSVEEFDVLETFERISETEIDVFLFFTPFQPGSVVGTITFFDTRDEAIAECSHTVALSGVGIVSLEPQLSVRPSRLLYSFVQQSPAAGQRLLVLNEGGGSLTFQVDAARLFETPWLSVSPLAGQVTAAAPVALTVEADPTGLAPNTYSGEIVISSPTNDVAADACRTSVLSGESRAIGR